jgi:Domain of unknown function (DUF4189)
MQPKNTYSDMDRVRPGPHRLPTGVSLAAACLLAALLLRPDAGRADAALAIGAPADVAKQGLAVGYALNYASREAAQAEALKRCREFRDAPEATRSLCRIVENFRNRCVAIALDPDAGTTGLGWAVDREQVVAEEIAMDRCLGTAGKGRRTFCRVTFTRCDGK